MSNTAIAKAVLFYADWCGHCQAMKPDWSKAKAYVKKYKLPLQVIEIEHSVLQSGSSDLLKDADVQRIMKQEIHGYPTLRLYNRKTNSVSEFNDMRTSKNLVNFFKQHVQQSGGAKKKTNKSNATKPKSKTKAAPKKGGFLRGNLLIQRANL